MTVVGIVGQALLGVLFGVGMGLIVTWLLFDVLDVVIDAVQRVWRCRHPPYRPVFDHSGAEADFLVGQLSWELDVAAERAVSEIDGLVRRQRRGGRG